MTVANDVSKLVTSTGGQISKRDVPSAVQSYASSSPPPFCLSVCLSVCMSLSVSMLFFFCFFLLLPRDSHCLLRVFSFVSFSFSSMFPKKCSCIIHLSSQRRFSPPSPAPAPSTFPNPTPTPSPWLLFSLPHFLTLVCSSCTYFSCSFMPRSFFLSSPYRVCYDLSCFPLYANSFGTIFCVIFYVINTCHSCLFLLA